MKLRNSRRLALSSAGLLCVSAGSLFSLSRCSGSVQAPPASSQPPSAPASMPNTSLYSPTTIPLGNVDSSCGKNQSNMQQQQVAWQQQNQQSGGGACVPQFQFYQSKISDLDVNLDCDDHVVGLTAKGGSQSQSVQLPIQSDGSVKGSFEFPQQVQNDGQGNMYCFVQTIYVIDGQATCAQPLAENGGGGPSQDTFKMNAQIEFVGGSGTPSDHESPSVYPSGSPSPEPSPSPSPEPSLVPRIYPPNPNPSSSPYSFPSPYPSSSPSTSPLPYPTYPPLPPPGPGPVPGGSAVLTCVVVNPCPIILNADTTCPLESP